MKECHEEVIRKGVYRPCDKMAVALRIDPEDNSAYPVCIHHVRQPMVPLTGVAPFVNG